MALEGQGHRMLVFKKKIWFEFKIETAYNINVSTKFFTTKKYF